jgi:hypothetical protein
MDVEQRYEESLSSAKDSFLTEAEKAGAPTFNVAK